MYSLFLMLGAALVAAAVFFGAAGIARAKSAEPAASPPVTARRVKSMSQEKIREMLGRIEAKKAPEPKMGAMCYDMAAPPARAEYVCPKCGEKTLYTKEDAWNVQWTVESCRREFLQLKSSTELSVVLDESSFCSHCSPSAKKHEMGLIVTYADGQSHTNSPVTDGDLRILQSFLKGELSFKTENDGTRPLKESLPRLRQLLGISAEQDTKAGYRPQPKSESGNPKSEANQKFESGKGQTRQ
jgi:hypothetical protein